mmetsp:Transcript_714/g.2035  ORF Transcript_714/g.2035 Transcript_714/m.2035 type:complete len:498 (+) Transcript_714:243-1736(+)
MELEEARNTTAQPATVMGRDAKVAGRGGIDATPPAAYAARIGALPHQPPGAAVARKPRGTVSLDALTDTADVSIFSTLAWAVGAVAAVAAAGTTGRWPTSVGHFASRCLYAAAGAMAIGGVALPALRLAVVEWVHRRQTARTRKTLAERRRRTAQWHRDAAASPVQHPNSLIFPSSDSRFDLDDPTMVDYLHHFGYVVVKGVASSDEVSKAQYMLWQFLKKEAGMDAKEPAGWTDARFATVGDPTTGILHGGGVGQSDASWYLRTLPRVRAAFANIWGTSDLIVSFDGANVFRPHHREGAAQHRTAGGWWHVDQGAAKVGLQSIQGFVSLRPATPATGGLCVVPRSHKKHADLLSYAAVGDSDFVVVPEPDVNPLVRGGCMVDCQPGDLVLWDSRTVHCNAPSQITPTAELGCPTDQMLREVVYICMTPRANASRSVLRRRRQAFVAGVTTTHWPHEIRSTTNPADLDKVSEAEFDAAVEARFGKGRLAAQCRTLIG